MSKKRIQVGVIKGIDILMNREGKANKADLMVTRGCGIHVPLKHKTKTKQNIKNQIKKGEWL